MYSTKTEAHTLRMKYYVESHFSKCFKFIGISSKLLLPTSICYERERLVAIRICLQTQSHEPKIIFDYSRHKSCESERGEFTVRILNPGIKHDRQLYRENDCNLFNAQHKNCEKMPRNSRKHRVCNH